MNKLMILAQAADNKIFSDVNISSFALALGILALLIAILAASRISKIIKGEVGVAASKPSTPAPAKVVRQETKSSQATDQASDHVAVIAAAVAAMLASGQTTSSGEPDPLVGFRICSIKKSC